MSLRNVQGIGGIVDTEILAVEERQGYLHRLEVSPWIVKVAVLRPSGSPAE